MAKGKYEYWLTPEGLLVLEGWARDGLTDKQIVQNIGISESTLYEWKKRYMEISEALKKGKEIVDRQVENALLKRALGYGYIETRTKEEGGDVTEIITTTKQVIPDVTAQIFWLKNRKPKEWRDRVDFTDESGQDDENIQNFLKAMNPTEETIGALFSDFSDDEEESEDDGKDPEKTGEV